MEVIKNILEISYYISGIGLLVIAAFGLKQITLAKETRKINSKREAFHSAAEQCRYYFEKIIPEIHKLDFIINELNINYFKITKVEVDGEKFQIKNTANKEESKKLVDESFALQFIIVANQLETFALYFTSGVAQDQIGYQTLGKTFVSSVNEYLPLLVDLYSDGNYKNLITLYLSWNARLEKETLLKGKLEIEQKLNKNINKSFVSIGTN